MSSDRRVLVCLPANRLKLPSPVPIQIVQCGPCHQDVVAHATTPVADYDEIECLPCASEADDDAQFQATPEAVAQLRAIGYSDEEIKRIQRDLAAVRKGGLRG